MRSLLALASITTPLLSALLLLVAAGSATGMAGNTQKAKPMANQQPGCAEQVSVHCGTAPGSTFDSSGRLWVVFVQGAHLYVSYSDDFGALFSVPHQVNDQPETIYADGENRPKIAIGKQKQIYLSWTKKTEGRFSGDVRFSYSLDQGKTFSSPRTINDDGLPTSHRFDNLLLDQLGHIYLIWLDKRDRYAAEHQNEQYKGAAAYYSISTDGGMRFSKNIKLADHSCECCRIAVSEPVNGGAAVFWRHVFNGDIRDHAFAELSSSPVPASFQRATWDNWKVDGCPHHGPALATQASGQYGLVWFTNGETNKGIYYGRFDAESNLLRDQFSLSRSPRASHADLLYDDSNQLFAAWKYFDGNKTSIVVRTSLDEGASWEPEWTIATTEGSSDHPFLLKHNNATFLSWHTASEGLRLIPISSPM